MDNRLIQVNRKLIALFMAVLMTLVVTAVYAETVCAAAKKPAKVKGLALKRSGLKIKATWKKAKNAKKYQVYMKIDSGAWKRKKTLTKRTLTVSGKYGTTYRFKVRAVNGKKKGKFSAVKKVTIPKKADPVIPVEEDGDISITAQPEDEMARDGENVTFKVACEGKNLAYQWYVNNVRSNKSGIRIAGATADEYTLNASPADQNTYYYCVISNGSASVRTRAAMLDVVLNNHIYITEQPEDLTVTEGHEAVFSVVAYGTGENKYQWYRCETEDGAGAKKLEGENKEKLVIDARLTIDDTYYYCKVRDSISMMTTDVVKLDVTVSPLRTKVVNDLEAFIEENGVLSEETITIDDIEFYVLAKEGEKALIFTKVTFDFLGENYFTPSGSWGYVDNFPGSIRNLLRDTFLKTKPTLDLTALETTLLTPNNKVNAEYYETKDRAFVLTEADITGYYSPDGTVIQDFTFDQTEDHIGRALPDAIIQGAEGNISYWVRSPEVSADPKYPNVSYIKLDGGEPRDYGGIPIGTRPALWIDLSIK